MHRALRFIGAALSLFIPVILISPEGAMSPDSAQAGELPPRQEKIVYTCTHDFIGDICSMNPDGTGEVALTEGAEFDEHPEISPDGRLIAWQKNLAEIWVMNLNGSNPHRVIEAFVHGPTWSPDGTMLAFDCSVGGEIGICTANADGSSGNTLVAALQGAAQPDWSPDGTKIIFQAQEVGENDSDIYVVTLANGQILNLTNTPDRSEQFPRWSPDGTKFAFWSEAPSGDPSAAAIFTANANGSNREEIFDNAPVSSPAWSPDGTQFAVTCTEDPELVPQMCIVDAQDGDVLDLHKPTGSDEPEIWSDPSWATGGGVQGGDIDCSGAADPIDSLKLLRHDAGLSVTYPGPCLMIGEQTTINQIDLTWGDVDCDGVIGAIDALKVLRFDAGLSVQQTQPCPPLGEFLN
jgi:Tol biopolymer transport system component